MELFDKKFVYLEWDDVLQGKKVFIADTFQELKQRVRFGAPRYTVKNPSDSSVYPFAITDGDIRYAFAYYDPNYECKLAYAQGKRIQVKCLNDNKWEDCVGTPAWFDECEYRVKPEPVDLCRVFFNKKARCMVIGSKDYVNSNNYPVLFEGSCLHCERYMREREKFNLVMAAYYCDGKKIQGRTKLLSDSWVDCTGEPRWSDACEYRVKPEDSKCNTCQYQCEPDMPCRTCRDGSNYKMRVVVKPEGTSSVLPECSSWQYQYTPNSCVTCEDHGNYKRCTAMQGEWLVKPKRKRRMTNREITRWLAEGRGECLQNTIVFTVWSYLAENKDKPVPDNTKIRGWDETEWHEPEVEE